MKSEIYDKKVEFIIRQAEENDAALLLDFIRRLADYEKRLHEVSATEEDIRSVIFDRKVAEAIIADYKGEPAGFAVFFHNFSTFLGKPGIYIEDLFVCPEFRGRGLGKRLFSYIAQLAVQRNCGRVEWTVLTWNEPAISFYKKIGAIPKDEWMLYKLSGNALEKLAVFKSKEKKVY
jgi:GNAT superfamily N-acetyltransferase